MSQFDIHAHRHELKQLKDAGATSLWESRGSAVCPVCETPFRRLLKTRVETKEFSPNDGARFCLLRDGETVHLFRH